MDSAPRPIWTLDQSTREKIDNLFSSFTNSTPGVALAIYHGKEVAYANGYGMSNLEHNVPITPSSIFHIASISKQFTAMCIALLQDDGVLNVDDPVQTYVPDLPTYDHPITVRHLIHHSSGIRDQWVLLHMAGWREDDLITEADCFELIKRQRELNFTPNDQYMYSNSGYTLLAMIVKAASGLSLREFAHQRIFAPLGMTRTHFHDDHTEIVPGRTQAYEPRDGGGYHISVPPFDVVGTTSLHTTVEDFAKWNGHFDAPSICSADVLRVVQSPGTFNDGREMTYAWGLEIDEWHQQRRVGHNGADHGYRSSFFRLPDLDFGIAIFANLSNVSPAQLAERVADLVLHDQLEQNPADGVTDGENTTVSAIGDTTPTNLAGIYITEARNGDPAMQLIVREHDGDAEVVMWDTAVPLPRQADGTYNFRDGFAKLWAIESQKDGTVRKLLYQHGSDHPTEFTRIADMDGKPAIEAFAGQYYSPELDVNVQFELIPGTDTMIWKQRKLKDQSMARLGDNVFGLGSLGASFQLIFETGEKGELTGFRFSGARIRNLRFDRHA